MAEKTLHIKSKLHYTSYYPAALSTRKHAVHGSVLSTKFNGSRAPITALYIVVVIFNRSHTLASAIQGIQANVITVISPLHTNCLSSSIGAFQEFAKFLFADFNGLCRCCVCHAQHWSPEVQGVGDVGRDTEKNEKDEVHWVTKNYKKSVIPKLTWCSFVNLPATISFHPNAKSKP